MKQPELKKISELLVMNFYVPSYQRGYRWTKFEVLDLLEDLKQLLGKPQGTKYCLQPLIVKDIDVNKYEVIDGQQRLTTIFLILKYISTLVPDETLNERYTLDYQTRPNSGYFLENIDTETSFNDTPDFYYMHFAYQTIKEWFEKQGSNKPV